MKKIVSLLLAVLMLTGAVALFASCGEKKTAKVLSEIELTAEGYAFAVQKGNTEMVAAANELLASLKSSGELEKIINSFFDGTATFTYENPVSALPTGDARANYLVVGTNAYFAPFEYYDGNKFTGIDMKIASLLAEKLGKTLYIHDMEFDAVIPATQNGECDISMAGMTVNDERKKSVDFTDEYYQSAQVLVVRSDDTLFTSCKTAEDVEKVLKAQSKSFTVGAQNGTTGYMYTAGDEDFGYDGFSNLTAKGYTNGALAIQDVINGVINAVVIDKQPAIMISDSLNGK